MSVPTYNQYTPSTTRCPAAPMGPPSAEILAGRPGNFRSACAVTGRPACAGELGRQTCLLGAMLQRVIWPTHSFLLI